MDRFTFEQRQRLENEVLPAVIDDPEYAASTIVRLEAQLAEAKDDWAREFEKRGTEVASVERQKALLVQGLYQIIDAWDGNDDSMSADPAEIARETLRKALAGGSE